MGAGVVVDQDGDDGDHGLGQGCPHGGQDAADRALVQAEPVADALDAVRKQHAGQENEPQTHQQHDDIQDHRKHRVKPHRAA